MKTFLKVVVIFCAVVSIFIVVAGITVANGAPQEAVFISMALFVAIIPYIVLRTIYL